MPKGTSLIPAEPSGEGPACSSCVKPGELTAFPQLCHLPALGMETRGPNVPVRAQLRGLSRSFQASA